MKKTNPLSRRLVAPEGIELSFQLASKGDRFVAFMIDGMILMGLTLALALLMSFAAEGEGILTAFFMIFFFLFRSGYFVYFELGPRGATPGKRSLGIRVVNRSGGPLQAKAVFARNLARELEIFLPILALSGAGGMSGWLSSLWVLVFLCIPFFNRDHMRVGDLIGGTWVVRLPKPDLLQDVGETAQRQGERYVFSDAQLGQYGNFELQTLEDLLRRSGQLPFETLELVSGKIQRRINWDGGKVVTETFLRDFYAAQRAHLERGLLFGRRHEDKGAARKATRSKGIKKRR